MSTDRRGFLKGLLAAPVAGGLLLRAEPTDVRAFAPAAEPEPVLIHRPSLITPGTPAVQADTLLYNVHGEPVIWCERVEIIGSLYKPLEFHIDGWEPSYYDVARLGRRR